MPRKVISEVDLLHLLIFFFFNDTASTEIYTLSLHDALPISRGQLAHRSLHEIARPRHVIPARSEEHTSELQSHSDLVCRLLLEKKKQSQQQSLIYPKKQPQHQETHR